jgi:hypothetical protein
MEVPMTMIQSGRPEHGALTRRVWEIADQMLAQTGQFPRGRDVVDAYLREDPKRNEGTGFTQYSHWKKAQGAMAVRADADDMAAGDADGVMRVTVSSEGVLRLSPAMLQALDIPQGGVLAAEVADGQLTLVAPMTALRRIQRLAQKYRKPGESIVDGFLAERRAIWGET